MTYQSPQPVHGHPGQPATRRNRMLVIGAVVGAVLFVCCCGAIARFADDNQPNAASPTSAAPTGVAVPTVISTPPVEVTQPATEPPVATTSAAPAEAVMPDLVGENAAVADDRLRKLGFTNIQFGSQDENDRRSSAGQLDCHEAVDQGRDEGSRRHVDRAHLHEKGLKPGVR